MKIDIIAGARPNFMKIAPIIRELEKSSRLKYRLIHTGQHYDRSMSDIFFEQLKIPKPSINLKCGGGSQSEQTSNIMVAYEKVIQKDRFDMCLVVGDVNSTLACSIVAKKEGMLLGHVEAGIRSFDMSMPEEINRLVTDRLSDYYYTTSSYANANLEVEGVDPSRIVFVGNTMIDTLMFNLPRIIKPEIPALGDGEYVLLTLHRPHNVDNWSSLGELITKIVKSIGNRKIIFPAHPRVRNALNNLKIDERICIVDPQPYLEFIWLIKHASVVVTDSGGITEEATVLEVPCLTVRDNTERPETIELGSNVLVGSNAEGLDKELAKILSGQVKAITAPPLWDGQSASRIVSHLETLL